METVKKTDACGNERVTPALWKIDNSVLEHRSGTELRVSLLKEGSQKAAMLFSWRPFRGLSVSIKAEVVPGGSQLGLEFREIRFSVIRMDFFADPRMLLFLGACLTLVAIPGPAVAFIVARSASEGTLAGTKTAAGIAIGNLCQALAAAFGLATLLNSYPSVYQAIKYAGAGYLVYLGVRSFTAKTETNATQEPIRTTTAFRQGALVGLLNPKVAVFLLAFLPQFTNPDSGALRTQLLFLGIGFVFIGWLGDTTWAVSAGFVGARLKRKGGFVWGRYAAGAVYCAVGVATALWEG